MEGKMCWALLAGVIIPPGGYNLLVTITGSVDRNYIIIYTRFLYSLQCSYISMEYRNLICTTLSFLFTKMSFTDNI